MKPTSDRKQTWRKKAEDKYVGAEFVTNQGETVRVLEILEKKPCYYMCTVLFVEENETRKVHFNSVVRGCLVSAAKKSDSIRRAQERREKEAELRYEAKVERSIIGFKGKTRHGQDFEVIDFGTRTGYYMVRFQDTGTKAEYLIGSIKTCKIRDPNYPSVHGLGISDSYTHNKLRRVWYGILGRCYDPNNTCYSTYGAKGVRVCKRWLRLSNFCEDMLRMENIEEYLEDSSFQWHLDKDILKPGNKIYSPNYCRIVTSEENQADGHTRAIPGKALIINNITYQSIGEAARHLGIRDRDVARMRKRAEDRGGYYKGRKYEVEIVQAKGEWVKNRSLFQNRLICFQ